MYSINFYDIKIHAPRQLQTISANLTNLLLIEYNKLHTSLMIK